MYATAFAPLTKILLLHQWCLSNTAIFCM